MERPPEARKERWNFGGSDESLQKYSSPWEDLLFAGRASYGRERYTDVARDQPPSLPPSIWIAIERRPREDRSILRGTRIPRKESRKATVKVFRDRRCLPLRLYRRETKANRRDVENRRPKGSLIGALLRPSPLESIIDSHGLFVAATYAAPTHARNRESLRALAEVARRGRTVMEHV